MVISKSLYIPEIEPRLKHPAVFRHFDALQNGEGFLLINDHDPIPLFYELKAERGNVFEWKKVENGPDVWKVEITKTGEGQESKPPVEETQTAPGSGVFVLNVTLLEPRLKHPTIFKHFDALAEGEAFQILNDHDPKPLYYQLIAGRGNTFGWEYLQKGPQWWQVEIRKNEKGVTVGELAAADVRKAEVFKKWGIDFCCGGKKTLKQACAEQNIDVAVVEAELANSSNLQSTAPAFDFNRWAPDFLADYIYNQHHQYYYQEGPVIADLLEKVASRHGGHQPELFQIANLYAQLQQELKAHFLKEERVLFPFIKALVKAKSSGDTAELAAYPDINEPVQLMEAEHEAAGEILAQLRAAANGFTLPAGACNSFGLLYKKLQDLEADLHQHIHLENNLLFPKALALEKEVGTTTL
jgi:regulator of cell morphogenesis and NO signaling